MINTNTEIYLEGINSALIESGFDYEKAISYAIENCPSDLDVGDYAFCILIGTLSCILNTSEKVEEFFDKIHTFSNERKVEWNNAFEEKIGPVLSNVLHHYGDNMDTYDGAWRARNSDTTGAGPHRILWGHDIFSINDDNPFYLLVNQYGFSKGIFQAARHLIADTCSKQGLPIPGHSWFDFAVSDGECGEKVHNYLVEFANKYSKEALGKGQSGINNKVFNSLFSVHTSDAISNGLVTAGLSVYFKVRGITDKVRIQQMRVIAYSFNFFGTCIIETIKSGGVPQINWISFIALSKNLIQLISISYKETKELDYAIKQLNLAEYEMNILESQLQMNILYDFRSALSGDLYKKKAELIEFFGGDE